MAMSLERFKAVLDAYGAAESRWPSDERQSALDLLEISEGARLARTEASGIDRLLDGHAAPPSTVALERRLRDLAFAGAVPAAAPPQPPAPPALFAFFSALFARPAYVGFASVVLAAVFVLGLLSADLTAPQPDAQVVRVFDDIDDEPVVLTDATDDTAADVTTLAYAGLSELGVTVRNVNISLASLDSDADLAELPVE